jgi:hypothetical protein
MDELVGLSTLAAARVLQRKYTEFTSSIIFIHGLGSNPDTTWGPRDGRCWVSDFLPEDIPAAFHKDVRIFFYNYDTYWKRDAVQTRLPRLGKGLLDHIVSDMRTTDEVGTGLARLELAADAHDL